jgi:hypothetical protein
VIACFIDIGGNVDFHCLNFLFILEKWDIEALYIYIELFLARQQRKYYFKRHNPPHLPQIRKRLISDMNILARELERQFLSYS